MQPKLSIITVNLNNAEGLRKTIESVVSQTFTDYEYIIIDGGSTDSSVDIIKQYEEKITNWVSEPDKGIYNAMNKGILKAKGEYCQFLNSGDWLVNENVLKEVFADFPDVDIVYGDLETEKGGWEYTDKISLGTFFFGSIPHPSAFIKISNFEKYGFYNENFQIVSDWEFFIKSIIINRSTYCHIKKVISYFEFGGMCTNENTKELNLFERKQVLLNYFPLMYNDYEDIQVIKEELNFYKNSRIIQNIKRILQSNLYRKIRGIA